MTRLGDYADNDAYTVDGEAGMIAHIFDRIEVDSKMCVEFGAGDGVSCSNTAQLWRNNGWSALLIEPDPARFVMLTSNAEPFDTRRRQAFVAPQGSDSISQVLVDYGIDEVDFMSIDIDGDDFFVLQHMSCRPRVICIEFNPTIPPHIEMHQTQPGESFGASLLAIVRLGAALGYRFVGASRCNAFLVLEPEAQAFDGYETNPSVLFSPGQYTYAVTDYHGRALLCGHPLPWQAKEPYVLPVDSSVPVYPISERSLHIRIGFESLYGPAWWLTPDGLTSERLLELLTGAAPPLVCIDLTTAPDYGAKSIPAAARDTGYRFVKVGLVVGLIKP